MKFNSKLMEKLTDCYSPSGKEDKVRGLIIEEVKDYVDEIKVDALGNLIAHKKGPGKKIMFASHMDQIGLIVTDITDKGTLKVACVGGMAPFKLVGQRMIFADGLQGVVCTERLDDFSKWAIKHLSIDIGVDTMEEALEKVSIGDMCVFHTPYYENDNYIMCKSTDDKIGCYIQIEALKEIKSSTSDIYYVFTVQEEVGCRGAQTAAHSINPDMCIAIDITPSGDGLDSFSSSTRAGKGVAVKLMDVALITHPEVRELLISTCKKNDIKYQLEAVNYGGTDAGSIHTVRDGIPSGVISIPTRNSHSSSEILNKYDVEAAVTLLKAIAN